MPHYNLPVTRKVSQERRSRKLFRVDARAETKANSNTITFYSPNPYTPAPSDLGFEWLLGNTTNQTLFFPASPKSSSFFLFLSLLLRLTAYFFNIPLSQLIKSVALWGVMEDARKHHKLPNESWEFN
ncbi:unnamed protein product [Citrullus colocynthis]|uniref:Uncharacterized protein n=1 Tax=Citrullus colocynthis TaxID=252529 RepID=A0ABP0YL56_9ROSI